MRVTCIHRKIYGIVNRGKIDDALVQEIERNSYDPVKEYLESLHWDGVPRRNFTNRLLRRRRYVV